MLSHSRPAILSQIVFEANEEVTSHPDSVHSRPENYAPKPKRLSQGFSTEINDLRTQRTEPEKAEQNRDDGFIIPRVAVGRCGPHRSATRKNSQPTAVVTVADTASRSQYQPLPTERGVLVAWCRNIHDRSAYNFWISRTFNDFYSMLCRAKCTRVQNFVRHVRGKSHQAAFFRLCPRRCNTCPRHPVFYIKGSWNDQLSSNAHRDHSRN